ncbi:MAG TPA: hypothetical protein VHX88_08840 [Solirubrobacteraceae bacterium]|nr:hypothetical protein [Solirubrobacteraceae bacterium]
MSEARIQSTRPLPRTAPVLAAIVLTALAIGMFILGSWLSVVVGLIAAYGVFVAASVHLEQRGVLHI